MALQSDLKLTASKFDPASISEQATKFNQWVIGKLESQPTWFEVGAPKYREMRWNGESAFPAPKVLSQGIDFNIPSREAGRDIPCRLMYPATRKTDAERKKCQGVIMHFHGGGWVLGDQKSTDFLLQSYADVGDVAVISVGYRHAPEDPFPKGPEDCFDAGEYLFKHSEDQYGGPLKFIGGESAGAHLSVLTTFHLLNTHPDFKLSGLLLHFGCYDLSQLPSTKYFTKPLVLNREIIDHFVDAFLPGMSCEQKQDPSISPFYQDLQLFRGRLPSALFTIGTEDALLDDSVFMATRWLNAGGHAILKVYSGAPHGFIAFPREVLKEAGEVMDDTKAYIRERLQAI